MHHGKAEATGYYSRCGILFVRKQQSMCQILFGRHSIIPGTKRGNLSDSLLFFPIHCREDSEICHLAIENRVPVVGQKIACPSQVGPGLWSCLGLKVALGKESDEKGPGPVHSLCMNMSPRSTSGGSREREGVRGLLPVPA